jgi:branched-chain amino acid transport system ATP-binding protein
MPLLEVEGLRAGYGSSPVLDGVTLVVEEGETDVLLGPNGAGKSTLLLCGAGFLRPWAGSIRFDGEDVTGRDASALLARGIVLMPQGRHSFGELTVEQNLRVGGWPWRRDREALAWGHQVAFELFPLLAERSDRLAGTLSPDERQMLALGRAVMAAPRLLLVDEVSLGLSPHLAQEIFRLTRRINAEGITLLMAEQNAGLLRHADRAYVMEKGRVRTAGPAPGLAQRDDLRAYLGGPLAG